MFQKGRKTGVFWLDIFIFGLISIRYGSVPKGTKRPPNGKKCGAAIAMPCVHTTIWRESIRREVCKLLKSEADSRI